MIDNRRDIDEAEIVFQKVSESVVILENIGGGWGTGFVVDAESGQQVIVTNDHVCDSEVPIFFIAHRSGNNLREVIKIPTTAIEKDTSHDLCIMAVPPGLNVKSIPLADEAHIDSKVYIVGYPAVPLLSSAQGYIRGTRIIDHMMPEKPVDQCVGKKYHIETVPIKQKNGKDKNEKRCFMRAPFLFTDALGEFGASGSPALNGDGEVVGVMSMIYGQARPFAHLVPLDYLRKLLSKH